MTIADFAKLFIDPDIQEIHILDNDEGKIVWKGFASEFCDDICHENKYCDEEITSIDPVCEGNIICLNIH